MDPDSTTPRQIPLFLTIIVGILLESGVFFLSLVFSGGYLLASLVSLAVLALLVVALLLASRRGRRIQSEESAAVLAKRSGTYSTLKQDSRPQSDH
jgi:hypothetical protein